MSRKYLKVILPVVFVVAIYMVITTLIVIHAGSTQSPTATHPLDEVVIQGEDVINEYIGFCPTGDCNERYIAIRGRVEDVSAALLQEYPGEQDFTIHRSEKNGEPYVTIILYPLGETLINKDLISEEAPTVVCPTGNCAERFELVPQGEIPEEFSDFIGVYHFGAGTWVLQPDTFTDEE